MGQWNFRLLAILVLVGLFVANRPRAAYGAEADPIIAIVQEEDDFMAKSYFGY